MNRLSRNYKTIAELQQWSDSYECAEINQAKIDYIKNIDDLAKAIKSDSKNHHYYKSRGLNYMLFGEKQLNLIRYLFGETILNGVFRESGVFSKKPSKSNQNIISELYAEASKSIHSFSHAIHDFNRAIKFCPCSISVQEIQSFLADAYNACGDYYQEVELLQQGITFLKNEQLMAQLTAKNLLRRIRAYTKAININADKILSYQSRADCYFQLANIFQGDVTYYQKAISDFTKLINSDPYLLLCKGYHEKRGHCYLSIGEYDKALKDFSLIEFDLENFNHLERFENRELHGIGCGGVSDASWITALLISKIIQPNCPIVFFLGVLEIIFGLKKFDFYNAEFLKSAELNDAILSKSYDEIFSLKNKLDFLKNISKKIMEEMSFLSEKKCTIGTFKQQTNFMLVFFKMHEMLQEEYNKNILKKEQEKAQAKIEERNKVIADLSHSIKNLISSVIDPLENMKNDTIVKQPIIDNAIRGANLVREIVNAMNLSYKGSIEDFRYDAKNNDGHDKQNIKIMILESLKNAVGNMYDGKYFSAFQEGYLQTKQSFIDAKLNWNSNISQSKNLEEVSGFTRAYFFETFIDIKHTEDLIVGNERGSAVKLLILFSELILNAVKYSSFVKRDKRFIKIEVLHNSKEVSVLIENRFNPKKRVKTAGLGNVVITNFAKLLNTSPVINRENDIYSVQITFENFWDRS